MYNGPMKTLRLLLAGAMLAGLCACNRPTYPANRVAQSVEELIKKEYGMDGTARVAGQTLYLDIHLAGLATTDTKKLSAVMEHIQGAVLTVTRVALSTDAPITFLVVTGNDPAWQIGLRIVEHLQDVKDYFYQRISRSDYEGRMIFELEFGDEAQAMFAEGVLLYPAGAGADSGMTMNEFAGRLIVSQFNTANRTNPFLSVVLNNTKLRYFAFKDRELIVKTANELKEGLKPLAQKILLEEAVKVIKKYNSFQLEQIRVIGEGAQATVISVPPVAHAR